MYYVNHGNFPIFDDNWNNDTNTDAFKLNVNNDSNGNNNIDGRQCVENLK